MTRRLALLIAALALVGSACGSGTIDVAEPGASPTSQPATTETIAASLPGGPALDASALTVDHPCGFGFAKGSADQTLGLVVFFTGDWTDEGPSLDEPIEFGPDSDWTGRISVGADLFANWCDDVVEEGEPEPRIDQEFEIVSGTLVGEVAGNFAEGMLTDLVAAPAAGGDIVEWAELEVRNEGWGFFAG